MLSMAQIGGGRGRAILATVLLALAAAACGGAASQAGGPAAPGATAAAAPGYPAEQPGAGGGDEQQNGNPIDQPGLLIIKTGTMALQVEAIDAALGTANLRIVALGGYTSGSERFGDGDSEQASVTFRVPAARWDEALTSLRDLATKILQERTSTQDVTDQVVDLGARIKNLQATEQALQAIMGRATQIKDVLTVQAELTKVRGEIEQLTAQKSNLEAQAAYSTVTVTFSLKPDPVLTSQEQFDPASEVDQASASLVGILQGLATAGIWFAIVWLPILLALALLALIGVVVYRRLRGSTPSGGEPVATPTADA